MHMHYRGNLDIHYIIHETQVIMDHVKSTRPKSCCWHWYTSFIYLTCVLHLSSLTTLSYGSKSSAAAKSSKLHLSSNLFATCLWYAALGKNKNKNHGTRNEQLIGCTQTLKWSQLIIICGTFQSSGDEWWLQILWNALNRKFVYKNFKKINF